MHFRTVRCYKVCNAIALQTAAFLRAAGGLQFLIFFAVTGVEIIVPRVLTTEWLPHPWVTLEPASDHCQRQPDQGRRDRSHAWPSSTPGSTPT